MIRKGRERLQGRVEIDEAYIGVKQEVPDGRGAEGKTLVLVAVEGKKGGNLGNFAFAALKRSRKKRPKALSKAMRSRELML